MRRSKLLVVVVILLILGVVVVALGLRRSMRCAGFPGPGVTVQELPEPPTFESSVRIATFNLRNFPLDERPPSLELGFSRRTNICDLEAALAGLGAQVAGFAEVCDTRRFPPILRRAGGERPMRILFSRGGGAGGQHLAIAWDGGRFELLEGPLEIDEVIVKPGLRSALALRLRSLTTPGLDFTVVQVHLDAGRDALRHRLEQVRALARWVDAWVAETGDPDVVLQGDFNTVGSNTIAAEEELALVDRTLARSGLARLDNATGCTQYWGGPGPPDGIHQASLLDLVYLRGLEAAGPARSWLHCERLQCMKLISRPGEEDGTFWDVSDHCPVTFELRAVRE